MTAATIAQHRLSNFWYWHLLYWLSYLLVKYVHLAVLVPLQNESTWPYLWIYTVVTLINVAVTGALGQHELAKQRPLLQQVRRLLWLLLPLWLAMVLLRQYLVMQYASDMVYDTGSLLTYFMAFTLVWLPLAITVFPLDGALLLPELFDREPVQELDGLCIDRLDVECTHYQPAPELLSAALHEKPVDETLVSHLLKSNCLVTGQPDWGSVQITYSGPQIEQAGLLQYIVSFRNHNEFHEQCVERIFMDIWTRCKPTKLTVYARYTRRGGLDINPWRTSAPGALPPNVRTARQ